MGLSAARRLGFQLIAAVLMLLAVAGAGWCVLPVSMLEPGMRGYGKTVLAGTEVTTFDVRIVDVVRSNGRVPDLILIKVGGTAIEQAGGISAGMSGSPVYIRDQLIGGIAYTTPFADTTYGYVAPIEYMLPLLDWPAEREDPWAVRGQLTGSLLDDLSRANSPVMVSGLSSRAFERLSDRLAGRGLRTVQGGAMGEFAGDQPLVPGSSVGIQLVRGDVNVTAVGTMTHVDGDRFIAFGHSFIHQGPCQFPIVATKVAAVVPSTQLPFKMASPGTRVAGTVTQDRQMGLGGRLGAAPSMVKLDLTVSGEHLAQPTPVTMDLVWDPELTAELVGTASLGAIDSCADREGVGSALVTLQVSLADGTSVTRADVVSTREDVGGYAALEAKDIVEALVLNSIGPVLPKRISLGVHISRRPALARIAAVRVEPPTASPGDTVLVTAELVPFRAAAETVLFSLRVPADAAPGFPRFRVHGKTAQSLLVYDDHETVTPTTLPEFLQMVEGSGKRRSLVCDLVFSPFDRLPLSLPFSAFVPVQPEDAESLRDLPSRPPVLRDMATQGLLQLIRVGARVVQDTAYVIEGDVSVPLRIVAR